MSFRRTIQGKYMKNEREISLWDLFWAVCLQWRKIILGAVICAVLMGAFSFYKSNSEIQQEKAAADTPLESVTLEEEQMELAQLYIEYRTLQEQERQYAEKSPIMQMDGTKVYRGDVSLYVDNHHETTYPVIEKNDNTDALVKYYESLLTSQQLSSEICSIYGGLAEDSLYYGELIDISTEEEGEGILAASVYAEDKEVCGKILQLVQDIVHANKEEAEKQFGTHDVNVISNGCVQTSDVYVINLQRDSLSRSHGYFNSLTSLQTQLTPEQLNYIAVYEGNLKKSAEQNEAAEAVPAEEKASVSIKYILVGIVGGAFVVFCFCVLFYILDAKIRLEDDLESSLNEKVLGKVILTEKKNKKWFAFLDKFLTGLRHYNKHFFEKKAAIQMIAANIKILAKQCGTNQIYVTGASCGEIEKNIVDQIIKELKGEQVKLIFGKPVLYNAEALVQMEEVGYALAIEQTGHSLYRELEQESIACADQGVKLLGYVIVDA